MLASEQISEMSELMNQIIYHQMLKLKEQANFISQFDFVYQLQEQELHTIREQCLAERLSLSKIKQQVSDKDDHAQETKIFKDNEFGESHK